MKITPKRDIFTPSEIEGIYREYRFLVGFVKHRCIVRCVDCFHATRNIYTVMEFLGGQNLAQYLSSLPGMRMSIDDSMGHFQSIASAVSHCHDKDVSHRHISLEHIVMRPQGEKLLPVVVDFRSSLIAKEGITSQAMSGTLPCMSPEMLSEGPYNPKLSDCWSVGVAFLEMSGGKGSCCHKLDLDEAAADDIVANADLAQRKVVSDRILAYFDTPGNHAAALACMGGVQDDATQAILERLLVSEAKRAALKIFVTIDELPVDDDSPQDEATK